MPGGMPQLRATNEHRTGTMVRRMCSQRSVASVSAGYGCRNIPAPGPIGRSSTTHRMSMMLQPMRNAME